MTFFFFRKMGFCGKTNNAASQTMLTKLKVLVVAAAVVVASSASSATSSSSKTYTPKDSLTYQGSLDAYSPTYNHEPPSFSSSSYPVLYKKVFTPEESGQMFRSAGCVNDEIRMSCSHDYSARIVIHNATFYSVPEAWLNCSVGPIGPLSKTQFRKFPPLFHETPDPGGKAPNRVPLATNLHQDLRQALNRRCSGITNAKSCNFNLRLDHEEAAKWGSGLVDLFYRCVPQKVIHDACSASIGERKFNRRHQQQSVVISTSSVPHSSQFLASPAYPKYYKGGRTMQMELEDSTRAENTSEIDRRQPQRRPESWPTFT